VAYTQQPSLTSGTLIPQYNMYHSFDSGYAEKQFMYVPPFCTILGFLTAVLLTIPRLLLYIYIYFIFIMSIRCNNYIKMS
jgi:hypothetical protein